MTEEAKIYEMYHLTFSPFDILFLRKIKSLPTIWLSKLMYIGPDNAKPKYCF